MRRATAGCLLLLCLGLSLVLSACGGENQEEILVFAAVSLTDVLDQLGDQFTDAEGTKVSFNLGGSAGLAQQIIRGAPADAFISAGPLPMDDLEGRGLLLAGSRQSILINELVLVGRPGAAEELKISSLGDLAEVEASVAIADPDLAPAGAYAREALQNLDLWERIEPRLIFSNDVRVAQSYVETGNVDVGIVYRTDVAASDDMTVLATISPKNHSPIVYPAGVIEGSRHEDAARRFLQYLKSDEAKATFREHGFVPLDSE